MSCEHKTVARSETELLLRFILLDFFSNTSFIRSFIHNGLDLGSLSLGLQTSSKHFRWSISHDRRSKLIHTVGATVVFLLLFSISSKFYAVRRFVRRCIFVCSVSNRFRSWSIFVTYVRPIL